MYELIKLLSIEDYVETIDIYQKQIHNKRRITKSQLYYTSKNTLRQIGELFINVTGYSRFLSTNLKPSMFVTYDEIINRVLENPDIPESRKLISIEEHNNLMLYRNASKNVLFSGWSVFNDTIYLTTLRNFRIGVTITYHKSIETFLMECDNTGDFREIKEVKHLLNFSDKEFEFTENFIKLFNTEYAK